MASKSAKHARSARSARPAKPPATARGAGDGGAQRSDPPSASQGSGDRRGIVLLAVSLAMLAVMLIPTVVRVAPMIYFDIDPRTLAPEVPIISLGPRGASWVHVISVLIAAAALGVHRWLSGRIRWGACVLAGAGMAVCLWQMPGHYENRLLGGAWTAGVALALAAAHLGGHATARRWLVAGLVAISLALLVDALWYVLVSHPQTIQQYEQNPAAVLEAHGWEEGSPQHLAYEQRLRATDATGAFGLSNVLGSLAAALTVLGAGMALALRPVKGDRANDNQGERRWMWTAVAGALAIGGAVTVWLTKSLGALLALPMGGALMVLAWIMVRGMGGPPRRVGRWVVPAFALALVAASMGAVLARGAIGPPETYEGERSLLFRAHYWQGAANMIVEHLPGSVLQGLGPAGFRVEYLWAKNPLNPENVTSAHNVFVDYITMLGLGGLAWSALLLLWLWQAGRGAVRIGARCEDEADDGARRGGNKPEPAQSTRVSLCGSEGPLTLAHVALAALPAAVVFGAQYVLQWQAMEPVRLLLWLACAVAFVFVTAGLALRGGRGRAWVGYGLLGAAAVVLIHNQIEMSFFQLASTSTFWAIVGLAASNDLASDRDTGADDDGPESPARSSATANWTGWLPAAGLGVVALALTVMAAGPITTHQQHMAQAASALQGGDYPGALVALDEAAETMPREDRALHWRVRLRVEMAQRLAHEDRLDAAAERLAEALEILAEAEKNLLLPGPPTARMQATVEQAAAALLEQPERLDEAVAARQRVVERSPYNLHDRIELGDLYWEKHQHQKAMEQYRAAQRISDAAYLEPMQQLNVEQREHIERRLRQAPTD